MYSEPKQILRSPLLIIAIIYFSLSFNFSVNGQVVDSLLNLLVNESLHDTSRVSLLNKLSEEYTRLDIEKSLHYAQKADSLSTSISYPIGKANSLRNIGIYHFRRFDFNEALELFREASQIFEQQGNQVGRANSLLSIGVTYNQIGNYDLALNFYQQSLSLWLGMPEKHKERIAAIYNNMGIIYRTQGNFPKALEYYQNSLLLKEEVGDRSGMSDTYNNMGIIYRNQHDYHKALDYYHKSLEIRQDLGLTLAVAMNYNNIGIVYSDLGDHASALEYHMESLNIRLDLGDRRGASHVYNNIGDAYFKSNELLLSVDYFQKGLDIATEIGRKPTQVYSLFGLAEVMFKQGDPKKAYHYSQQALELANEIGDITILKKAFGLLSEISADLGLYRSAFDFLTMHKAMSDSLQNQEVTKKIVGLEYEYKYQKDRVEQEKKDIEQQVKYTRQKQMTLVFIVSFLLTLAMVVIVLLSFRRKQKDFKIISDQKKLLQEQALKLQELDEIKSRFFTNISHEFRTPLTLILGPVEQLIEQCDDPKAKPALGLIHCNAQNLLGLINQLLDISRIERGAVKMSLGKGSIARELALIVEMFASQAQSKGVELRFNSEINNDVSYLDKEKLERIMYNLISNAVKNTDEGKITVLLKDGKKQEQVQIEVTDTGRGIEKEKLPYIFDRFYMADEAGRMGSGIGLAFAWELVKTYKGSITVESQVGKGTSFTLILPISKDCFSANEIDLVGTPLEDSAPLQGFVQAIGEDKYSPEIQHQNKHAETILLVEDHDDLRQFIASNLRESYRVLEAENGRIGIDMAQKEMPDLIVTDVMMPEVDGIELTRTLKNTGETSHIPIVMLTAKASEDSRIQGLETEADDYLTKPFSNRELSVRIQNLLKIRHKLREKFMRSIQVNPSEITTNSMDEEFVSKILKVVEDNMDNPDFSVETLCEKAGIGRSTLHNKLKSLLDQSATEFINTIRVKRAAQLIKQKTGSISEIAYDVGYNNLSYFTKQFKKHFKITPSKMVEGS